MSERYLPGVKVFSTCPMSRGETGGDYVARVADVARWSEAVGCEGILVYTDNGLVDPWLVSQVILQNTSALCPLVAIQPVYMHPYTAANMVTSLAYMHGRRIYLNMLAGGFKNDLRALDDETPHDDRYVRTTEYTLIIRRLLEGKSPVTFDGKYYKVTGLKLVPPLPEELFPGVLISGSSAAGMQAAMDIGAVAVKYPKPPGEEENVAGLPVECGMRVGIVARRESAEAWRVARERFPEDRKGQLAHQMAMKVSDSKWHEQLSELGNVDDDANPYWLGPFKNYKTFCPYLVGSHARVAREIGRYVELGFRVIILDIPPSREELEHIGEVFRVVAEETGVDARR